MAQALGSERQQDGCVGSSGTLGAVEDAGDRVDTFPATLLTCSLSGVGWQVEGAANSCLVHFLGSFPGFFQLPVLPVFPAGLA